MAAAAPALGYEEPAKAPAYTPFVDRGMSLPAPFAYGVLGMTSTARAGEAMLLESTLGAGAGLSSRVWIDASAGTLQLAPGVGYHSPQVGLNALLVDTPAFELDATTHVTFASAGGDPVEQVEPGLFTVIHVAHKLRIDGGLYLNVSPGEEVTAGMRAPVAAGFQIGRKVYAQVTSGVTVSNFADARNTAAVPLGLTLGWSDRLREGGPSVAVLPSVSFPELWRPLAEEPFRPEHAVVGVTFVIVSKL